MVASSDAATKAGPLDKIREFRRDLSPRQWLQTKLMFGSIVLLHVVGFGIFIFFVVPGHYKGLGIGVSVLAYTLGLRHAFDADHIAAIDNTTRKLMNEGKKPISVGYFFSLGHSTIVVAIGVRDPHRREDRLRRGLEPGVRPRAVRRDFRDGRFGHLPLPDRLPEHHHPVRDHRGVQEDASWGL